MKEELCLRCGELKKDIIKNKPYSGCSNIWGTSYNNHLYKTEKKLNNT